MYSTNPENLAKIGPVDFEIIGLTGIVKINKKRNRSETYSPPCLLPVAGWDKLNFNSLRQASMYYVAAVHTFQAIFVQSV